MNWFTKPLSKPTTIARENPASTLDELECEYRAAESRWDAAKKAVISYRAAHPRLDAVRVVNDKAILHVNTLRNSDPQLDRLCGIERSCAAARNEALRAMLRQQGKVQ
jgi:hypothetical protein